MSEYNAKNRTEQGGEKTVIGGTLEVLPGATIVADEGATVEGFGGGEYVLPVASEDDLGGIKVGETLRIMSDGTLNVVAAQAVDESEAEDIAGVNDVLNALISALKECHLMNPSE